MEIMQQAENQDFESANVGRRGPRHDLESETPSGHERPDECGTDAARPAIIKSITIDAPMMRVLLFVSDPMQWLRQTLFNAQDISPITDVMWCVSTALRPPELQNRHNGVIANFKYAFMFDGTQWTVPGRILKNGSGSELVLTLFQHELMTAESFQSFSRLVDDELLRLKKLMEIH